MPDRGADEAGESGLRAVALANRTALLRFIRARGGGADAEDIFQDLWLKLVPGTLSGPIADPLSYLYRVADNMMHDRRRATARRMRRDSAWSEIAREDERQGSPSAERTLAARDELAGLERVLSALGDRTDAIFRRFRLEGATQKAIAAEHGISLSAVEKHLQRAYRAIMAWRSDNDAGGDAGSGAPRRLASEDPDDAAR